MFDEHKNKSVVSRIDTVLKLCFVWVVWDKKYFSLKTACNHFKVKALDYCLSKKPLSRQLK